MGIQCRWEYDPVRKYNVVSLGTMSLGIQCRCEYNVDGNTMSMGIQCRWEYKVVGNKSLFRNVVDAGSMEQATLGFGNKTSFGNTYTNGITSTFANTSLHENANIVSMFALNVTDLI